MSGRNPKKAKGNRNERWYEAAWVSGLLLIAVGAYLGLSLSAPGGPWWRMIGGGQGAPLLTGENPGGPVGALLATGLQILFGAVWVWACPALLILAGAGFLWGRPHRLRPLIFRLVPLWLATVAWTAQPAGPLDEATGARFGGIVGFYLARGFHALFGTWGGRIFLTVILLVVVVLLCKRWFTWLPAAAGRLERLISGVLRGAVRVAVWPFGLGRQLVRALAALPGRLGAGLDARRRAKDGAAAGASAPAGVASTAPEPVTEKERVLHTGPELPEPETAAERPPRPETETMVLPGAGGNAEQEDYFEAEDPRRQPRPQPRPRRRAKGPVVLPRVDLLTPAGPEIQTMSRLELDASADLLEETLRSFGVEGEVRDVRPGPVVTTFEYQPGSGIRVNQIVQRSDDLALAMRARSIRMEAPIPGKAAVGIEIPNPKAKMVRLREVLELASTEGAPQLTVVLGKDVVGRPVSVDIASLPHLLVAGSTGSGKSVCLNALICNLLLRNDPGQLRLVLIDPKMLELNVYNGIPHLLLPVVTDPREALKALQWMVAQMEFRYRQLSKCSVRNILQYNEKVARGEIRDEQGEAVTEPMPYYVTIVDELADLMLQLGNDMEGPITRLAQKARAVGIHLILATQRPSVDVLTGVIKANIPCRIAFRVIQKNDSRTILDMNGAEQLLGHGDMLYLQPGRALPVRVHGSFIDVDECEAIAAHWRTYGGTTEEISLNENPSGGGMVTGEDDLFDEAKRIVILHQSGSTSLLQRRLRIGYTRAGRLMDMLEEAGVVGPFTGSKARDVLIKPEEVEGEA